MRHAIAHSEQMHFPSEQHNQAVRFAAGHACPTLLRWLGDDIGLDAGHAAKIDLLDQAGRVVSLTLAETLAQADEINARGLYRILAAARCAFEAGDLSAADTQAWRQWVAGQMGSPARIAPHIRSSVALRRAAAAFWHFLGADMQAIPSYAVDLLIAAKAIAAAPVNATPEALEHALQILACAVVAFEEAMRVANGEIVERPSATGA